ncbi:MAG TPA: glycosyltransferase family 87 protein [Tepidisphaeraceae bacterium]|nr:glycosyltransferase family 87 protein [Tepidisphaeraceae bacterium]
MAIPVIARRHCEWDTTYYTAASNLVSGRPLYYEHDPFVYPPFSALISTPFVLVPVRLARVLWYFLVLVPSLVYLLKAAWRLSGGGQLFLETASKIRIHLFDQKPGAEDFILWLGCAAALPFVGNALAHVQTDLLIAALVMVGIGAVVQRRFFTAAVWFGLAAAFKGPPALFAVYLLIRRKFLPALLMVGICLGCNLAPNLLWRPLNSPLLVREWFDRYVIPLAAPTRTPGSWFADPTDNQSLSGTASRLFLTVPVTDRKGFRLERRLNPVSTRTLQRIIYGCEAALGITVIAAMGVGRVNKRHIVPVADRTTIECSLVLLLMLLLPPMSGRAHFAILLLPTFCLARAAITGRDRIALTLLVCAIIAAIISFNAFFVPKMLVLWSLWLGVVTLEALLLLIGLIEISLKTYEAADTTQRHPSFAAVQLGS